MRSPGRTWSDQVGAPGNTSGNSTAWYGSGDALGVSPYRLTAGFMSQAYKERFGIDHKGVDYGAKTGTSIKSPVDGVVEKVGYDNVSGNYVVVRDDHGRSHLFAHMNTKSVTKGARVSAGAVLGTVGSTGRSTGPHVHYGVRQDNKWINPKPWAQVCIS